MNSRSEDIEAFVKDILTQCANKGFSIKEVDALCACLQHTFREAKSKQVHTMRFVFAQSGSGEE